MAFGNCVGLCWQVGAWPLFEWPRSWKKYCNIMCEVGSWVVFKNVEAHIL